MERICVFCGSGSGARPEYLHVAETLGHLLVSRGLGLVYGGANVGVMGALARAVLEDGGEVIGVIPQSLVAREIAFTELHDLRVVGSMHERKALMASLSDGFIALPGGIGTLEEFFEVWTWAKLGLHQHPCGLLNVCGYYDGLIGFMDHIVDQQFLKEVDRSLLLVDAQPEGLLDKFSAYQASGGGEAAKILQTLNNPC